MYKVICTHFDTTESENKIVLTCLIKQGMTNVQIGNALCDDFLERHRAVLPEDISSQQVFVVIGEYFRDYKLPKKLKGDRSFCCYLLWEHCQKCRCHTEPRGEDGLESFYRDNWYRYEQEEDCYRVYGEVYICEYSHLLSRAKFNRYFSIELT